VTFYLNREDFPPNPSSATDAIWKHYELDWHTLGLDVGKNGKVSTENNRERKVVITMVVCMEHLPFT